MANTLNRWELIYSIINIINSSLDINEIKKNIVNEVGQLFKADRCFIRIFDNSKDDFLPLDEHSEYLSSEKIKSVINVKPVKETHYMIKQNFKKGKGFSIPELEEFAKENPEYSEPILRLEKIYKLKSTYSFPIFYQETLIGGLVLHYTESQHTLKDEDLKLLNLIAEQIGISLNHAKLYKIIKANAERENLLRKIIETVRSSLNIKDIKKQIVESTGKSLKAQRVFIVDFDEAINSYVLPIKAEYLANPGLKSITCKICYKDIIELANRAIRKTTFIEDTEKFLKEFNIENSTTAEFLRRMEMKSGFSIPIFNRDKFLGILVIHYTERSGAFGEEEIKFVETLADQIGIALHQAKLYETVKEFAEREELLRKTISTVRTTLDVNEMKKKIVLQVGESFGVNRCVINQFNPQSGKFYTIDSYSEYLSSPDEASFVGINLEKETYYDYFKKLFASGKIMFAPDWEGYINNLSDEEVSAGTKELIKKFNIKSNYIFPLIYNQEYLGSVYLNFTREKRIFSEDELETIKSIMEQISVAFYHAKLYEKEKLSAKREKFLSEISSIVKSTMEIEDILTLIFRKVKKFFDVKEVLPCRFLIRNAHISEDFIDKCNCLERNNNKNDKVRFKKLTDKCFQALNSKYAVTIPVRLEGYKIENIYLLLDEERDWQEEDINLFEKISDNISIALRESSIYSKSRFLSDVSHELRTPIAIIEGYINSLLNRQDYSQNNVEKCINIIKKNTIRIRHIIENLIYLSQVEETKEGASNPIEEIKVEKLIKNVLQIQKSFMTDKKITFETSYDKSLKVEANEVLLEQALLNLVQNAVHYSQENSKVILSAEKKGDYVSLKVQDFGCGIEQQHLKNIFKRFYRADKSRSRETGGSGLGLSIVENIVKTYNGKIYVESEPGKGSTFSIEIPSL